MNRRSATITAGDLGDRLARSREGPTIRGVTAPYSGAPGRL